jgi:hypothetical protein
MNWEAVGAISEIGGAVGVIATLVYLALQIRRSTASENANAYDDLMNGWHQGTALLLESSNRTTFMKALDGYDKLDDDERVQFHVLAAQMLDRFESMLQFRVLGVADKTHPAEQFTPFVVDLMSNMGFQRFWQAEHGYFSSEMKNWMKEHCPNVEESTESGFAANIVRSRPE